YRCTGYTDIFGIILGGGMVLAGPWLMFHYVGMCIRGVENEIAPFSAGGKKGTVLLIILTLSLLAWEYLFVIKGFNKGFGAIFGYGDILLTWFGGLEVLLMMLWFVTAGRLAGFTKEREVPEGVAQADHGKSPEYGKICTDVLSLPGRHSLYIFLYHILFLRLYVDHLLTRMLNISHLLNRICLILAVFAGPVLISVIVKRLRTIIFSK
ncbi:MAG: hypothetical protein K6E68_10495, partial [Lachnospiraceae bacterium]|nr:hypothetical protein [Lachnospiraceae bacterium]